MRQMTVTVRSRIIVRGRASVCLVRPLRILVNSIQIGLEYVLLSDLGILFHFSGHELVQSNSTHNDRHRLRA